jgi:glycerol-3-phosphate dehydrogenase
MNRTEIVSELKEKPEIDVLVVGGGINGAGTFLDLAINDVNVLLIDRGDFCSGASATSSHMAHGGIRYLENGEFRLVREAVAERNRMIQNSPHMVKPLPTVIPMFKLWSGLLNAPFKFLNLLDKPSERGALVIKIGLIFYDSFTGKNRIVPAHKFYGKKETFSRYPRLNKDVNYTAVYYDGQIISPERLNTEIILDGETLGSSARALNYAELIGFENGYVVILDHKSNKKLMVKPKMIINAAGPWVDNVNSRFGMKSKYIGGTKGSHIIVNNPELKSAIGENEFFFENKDGRIVLLFPFFDKVIIGTSDLPIDNPDDAYCTKEEEQYFINLVKRVFPDILISPDQIVFRFSGVRPLEYQQAKTTGQITRDHSMKENVINDIPVMSLIGGKWTSYRAFGEQISDQVLLRLGKSRKQSTERLHIGGGKNYPGSEQQVNEYISRLAKKTNTDETIIKALFNRYGTLAEKMLMQNGDYQIKVLDQHNLITENEVVYLAQTEKIVHLDDLILRRSSIGWTGQVNPENLVAIAKVVGVTHGWTQEEINKELIHTREIFKKNHAVML